MLLNETHSTSEMNPEEKGRLVGVFVWLLEQDKKQQKEEIIHDKKV
jgi:hypothetical protein